jgi:hypothetical protein
VTRRKIRFFRSSYAYSYIWRVSSHLTLIARETSLASLGFKEQNPYRNFFLLIDTRRFLLQVLSVLNVRLNVADWCYLSEARRCMLTVSIASLSVVAKNCHSLFEQRQAQRSLRYTCSSSLLRTPTKFLRRHISMEHLRELHFWVKRIRSLG